ncbi:unnamed protein product [Orchesella dallaii]|uniref:Pickpocket protein 28 n=1 Tax=Orchesella dallaii TaxID=48710 RepID=A0ABP1QZY6_9HEXA
MSEFENCILWKQTLLQKQFLSSASNIYQHEENPLTKDAKPTSKFARWFWWEPNQDSWLNEFCGSSVIHGLKYLSKRRLSVVERVFWVAAFLASLYASWLMIIQVWDRYHKSPVIVTFNPSEQETYQLPFPAVTICNKSLFHKSKIEELIQ